MADLILKVSTEKYEARISTLQGYVQSLQTTASDYQRLRNEVDNLWQSSEADSYKNAIDANIANVNKAIEAANLTIEQLQQLVQTMGSSTANVSQLVEETAELAKNLFL